MGTRFSSVVVDRFQQRRALLWVCKRRERLASSLSSDANADASAAIDQYRTTPDEIDSRVAAIGWEAIWLDSPRGLLIDAIVSGAATRQRSSNVGARRPITLAVDPDEEGQLDTRELLPIYCPDGLFEHPQADGRVGAHSPIKRLLFRLNLLRKIKDYPNRLLVILGAEVNEDVRELFEILDSFAPVNLHVLLVWPPNAASIEWQKQQVGFEIWRGTTGEFLDELESLESRYSTETGPVSLRIGQRVVAFDESELFGITERFRLITENQLRAPVPEEVTIDEFESFIKGDERTWFGYAAGFAFDREYLVDSANDVSLIDFVVNELRTDTVDRNFRNQTITIPAHNGAGISTLLRLLAFRIAHMGFPVLVMKSNEVGINIDAISAFLTRVSIKTEKQQPGQPPVPALIVFDTDHQYIQEISFLAQRLASQGRSAVILRAETARSETGNSIEDRISAGTLRVQGRQTRLPILRSTVTPAELQELAGHFSQISDKYQFGLDIHNINDWYDFQSSQTHTSSEGSVESESLFWVALHFFLFNGSEPPQNYQKWLTRSYSDIPEHDAREAVVRIAAMSSFRLVTPLIPLLRSISGGLLLDLELVAALARFDTRSGLVAWDSRATSMHDQVLRFRHPLLASLFLDSNSFASGHAAIQLVLPIIRNLKAGGSSDQWLIESLAYQVLRTFKNSSIVHIEESLEIFREIPPQISDYNKVILHHWGRALYHYSIALYRSREQDLEGDQSDLHGIDWLNQAAAKLEKAVDLPTRSGRDENPSHLYNTLGSIYFELYRRLSRHNHEQQLADRAWEKAAVSFERSLALQADNFAALCAYGQRLIQVAQAQQDIAERLDTTLLALSYLDEAEDIVDLNDLEPDDIRYLDEQRYHAWRIIGDQQAQEYLDYLLKSSQEAGFLIRARQVLRAPTEELEATDNQENLDEAIRILEHAMSNTAYALSWRTPYLLYNLYLEHPSKRFLFARRLELLRTLEQTKFNWHVRMLFDYAVLCYQVRSYDEGQRKFQELRKLLRQSEQSAKRLQDFLRAAEDPRTPQVVVIRLRRVDNEWRGYGFVQEFGHEVLLRPRHFDVPPKVGDYRNCIVRFETMGPIAVPVSFPTSDEWSQ